MLPIFRPLKDPAVATVWSGLAASTIGEDLFRVAVVWIAAEQIGNAAGYVNAAQYGAMLVAGLLGASVIDRWRADRAMIWAKYASAALALMPVAGAYVWGVSIPLLVLAVMGIAALRMVFTPALQSAVPVLVPNRDAMQAINGLFDATWRLARLIGPMLAAVLNSILPVIHFLSVTAAGFVLSGVAIWAVRDRLIDPTHEPRRGRGGLHGAWDALVDGARLMRRERTIGTLLLVNALANGPWSVAWLVDNPYKLPAMMAAGLIAGFGGPFYFIPMITRLQTAYRGAEIARVFRLRLAVMAGSMLAFNLAATPLFNLLGPTLTEFLFGLLILALGIGGHFYFGRIESRPQKIPV